MAPRRWVLLIDIERWRRWQGEERGGGDDAPSDKHVPLVFFPLFLAFLCFFFPRSFFAIFLLENRLPVIKKEEEKKRLSLHSRAAFSSRSRVFFLFARELFLFSFESFFFSFSPFSPRFSMKNAYRREREGACRSEAREIAFFPRLPLCFFPSPPSRLVFLHVGPRPLRGLLLPRRARRPRPK